MLRNTVPAGNGGAETDQVLRRAGSASLLWVRRRARSSSLSTTAFSSRAPLHPPAHALYFFVLTPFLSGHPSNNLSLRLLWPVCGLSDQEDVVALPLFFLPKINPPFPLPAAASCGRPPPPDFQGAAVLRGRGGMPMAAVAPERPQTMAPHLLPMMFMKVAKQRTNNVEYIFQKMSLWGH